MSLEALGKEVPLHKPPWHTRAACVGADTDIFFNPRRVAEAKRYCVRCPVAVREACLEDALSFGPKADYGVYGNTTRGARRKIRHKRLHSQEGTHE